MTHDTATEKQLLKRNREFERRKREFLQHFAGYQTEKPREIAASQDKYADYAVAAAEEILSSRSQ